MKRRVLRFCAVAGSLVAGGAALVASVGTDQLGAGQTASASDGDTALPEEPTTVELTTAQVGEVSTYITATANLVARTQIDVVAEASGRIKRVHVDEGDDVSGGAALVSLDAKSSRMAVKTARIKLQSAGALQTRAAVLANKELVSTEELEKLTTDRDVAQQSLEEARLSLTRRGVRAPRAGRITRRDVAVGQYVREGDTLFELTDLRALEARIHVPERDVLALEKGREVELVLQARADVKFPGVVHTVSSKVDSESGTVEVTIRVADPPAAVRSGSFVGVKLIRTRNTTATWLPREAAIRGPRGAHVFVVEDGVAHRREVVTGSEERGRLEITEGIEAGDHVVLSGHGGLKDGSAVESIEAD